VLDAASIARDGGVGGKGGNGGGEGKGDDGGNRGAAATAAAPPRRGETCKICMDDEWDDEADGSRDTCSLPCDCRFHFDCIGNYLHAKIQARKITDDDLRCPNKCDIPMTFAHNARGELVYTPQHFLKETLTRSGHADSYVEGEKPNLSCCVE